jgi:hypothetical protein
MTPCHFVEIGDFVLDVRRLTSLTENNFKQRLFQASISKWMLTSGYLSLNGGSTPPPEIFRIYFHSGGDCLYFGHLLSNESWRMQLAKKQQRWYSVRQCQFCRVDEDKSWPPFPALTHEVTTSFDQTEANQKWIKRLYPMNSSTDPQLARVLSKMSLVWARISALDR